MNNLPDFKQLKKLADACRKAGIQSFKGFGMEFTLTDEAPKSEYKKRKAVHQDDELPLHSYVDTTAESKIEEDSLTDEQMLFYSSHVGGENTSFGE